MCWLPRADVHLRHAGQRYNLRKLPAILLHLPGSRESFLLSKLTCESPLWGKSGLIRNIVGKPEVKWKSNPSLRWSALSEIEVRQLTSVMMWNGPSKTFASATSAERTEWVTVASGILISGDNKGRGQCYPKRAVMTVFQIHSHTLLNKERVSKTVWDGRNNSNKKSWVLN